MRLLLIRHAQTIANHQGRWQGHADYPLSARGHTQVECLAGAIAEECQRQPEHWRDSVLYSSSLGRAEATARGISEALALRIHSREALREYDVGLFSGRTRAEIEAADPEIAARFRRDGDWDAVPDAESFAERARRADSVVSELITGHHDAQTIICVTHGGFIQYLIASLLGTRRVWGMRPDNTAIFEFSFTRAAQAENRSAPGGLSTYRCRIQRFNDTAHLRSLPAE